MSRLSDWLSLGAFYALIGQSYDIVPSDWLLTGNNSLHCTLLHQLDHPMLLGWEVESMWHCNQHGLFSGV